MDEVQLHLWALVEGGQFFTCGKSASNSHRSQGDPSALRGQNLVAAPRATGIQTERVDVPPAISRPSGLTHELPYRVVIVIVPPLPCCHCGELVHESWTHSESNEPSTHKDLVPVCRCRPDPNGVHRAVLSLKRASFTGYRSVYQTSFFST